MEFKRLHYAPASISGNTANIGEKEYVIRLHIFKSCYIFQAISRPRASMRIDDFIISYDDNGKAVHPEHDFFIATAVHRSHEYAPLCYQELLVNDTSMLSSDKRLRVG